MCGGRGPGVPPVRSGWCRVHYSTWSLVYGRGGTFQKEAAICDTEFKGVKAWSPASVRAAGAGGTVQGGPRLDPPYRAGVTAGMAKCAQLQSQRPLHPLAPSLMFGAACCPVCDPTCRTRTCFYARLRRMRGSAKRISSNLCVPLLVLTADSFLNCHRRESEGAGAGAGAGAVAGRTHDAEATERT